MMYDLRKKVSAFLSKYGVYVALVAFLALLISGLRVLDEADGGLVKLPMRALEGALAALTSCQLWFNDCSVCCLLWPKAVTFCGIR